MLSWRRAFSIASQPTLAFLECVVGRDLDQPERGDSTLDVLCDFGRRVCAQRRVKMTAGVGQMHPGSGR